MRMTLSDCMPNFDFSPVFVFLDIKFSTRRLPYAYGLVVTQGDELRWETGVKCAEFWKARWKADADAMRAIVSFESVEDVIQLMDHLRDQLLQVERLDFMCGMKAQSDPRELVVMGNSMTVVYTQLLMIRDRGFDISDPTLLKEVTLKQVGADLGLPDPLFNPLSSAKAMAHLVSRVNVRRAA